MDRSRATPHAPREAQFLNERAVALSLARDNFHHPNIFPPLAFSNFFLFSSCQIENRAQSSCFILVQIDKFSRTGRKKDSNWNNAIAEDRIGSASRIEFSRGACGRTVIDSVTDQRNSSANWDGKGRFSRRGKHARCVCTDCYST